MNERKLKVEVVATYKSGASRMKEFEWKSDDFLEHMDKLWDKIDSGEVHCIIISVIRDE
jgi:hypothetical protein